MDQKNTGQRKQEGVIEKHLFKHYTVFFATLYFYSTTFQIENCIFYYTTCMWSFLKSENHSLQLKRIFEPGPYFRMFLGVND